MLTRRALLTACFFLFLYPVSYEDSTGTGLSVNYSFVLLPVLWVLSRGAFKRPPPVVVVSLVVFTLVFWLALAFHADEAPIRRVVSFGIFMTVFAFALVTIDEDAIRAFKQAVVGISILFSFTSLYAFVRLDPLGDTFAAKNAVGWQRFGFIYIVAAWLTYWSTPRTRARIIAKYAALALLLAGLLLTFSRASIVALVGSVGLFALSRAARWMRRPSRRAVRTALLTAGAGIVLLLLLNAALPTTFQYFRVRLVDYALDTAAIEAGLANRMDSLGARLTVAREAVELVADRPLTGSGFLGVWILPNLAGVVGSAHNQYLDVFFRTGAVGFLVYLWLLGAVASNLRATDEPLFWGLVGVFIFGFFHETFKESQGTCLLAFLVGMTAESRRRSRRVTRPVVQAARPIDPIRVVTASG